MSLLKKKKPDVIIYSKWCLLCEKPQIMLAIDEWCMHKKLTYQVRRTAYRPWWHKKAIELWASAAGLSEDDPAAANYPSFVVWKDIKTVEEFYKMIEAERNKLVKGGKTKDDMQRLSKTKRSARKDSVADTVPEVATENEEKVSE